jgi:alpha-tubulin suppressor-like RCC1 family protein
VGAAGERLPAPIAVVVLDANETPVTGAVVTFVVTQGGGAIDPTVTTNGAGIARASWTLGTIPGGNRAEAGTAGVEPVTLGATGTVGPAAKLVLLEGGDQTAVSGWPVPIRPAVRVTDRHGNSVFGVPVQFSTTATDGWVESGLQLSDSLGQARVGSWFLPQRTGVATLRVGASGPLPLFVAATALGLRPVAQLEAAHGLYTCGLRPEGEAFCFGSNENGERGDSMLVESTAPVPVSGNQRFVSISGGAIHACGLTSEGRVYCWGSNASGQLGRSDPAPAHLPTLIAGNRSYRRIAAGASFTCALDDSGAPFCWGFINGSGVPAPIASPEPLAELAAGTYHACGLTAAGAAYCWGDNSLGQLGDGSQDASTTPVAVSGGRAFTRITAGHAHTCALTSDGSPYCWGYNRVGQLGDSTQITRNVPTGMVGGVRFVTIDAGSENTCGLTAEGAAFCVGDNGPGAVGLGYYDDLAHPVPAAVVGGHRFTVISVGGIREGWPHVCAATVESDVYCWGSHLGGALGTDGPNRHTPTRANQQ